MAEDENNLTSKYNAALLQVQRMAESWKLARDCLQRGQYAKCKHVLDTGIWLELAADANEKETSKQAVFNKNIKVILANKKMKKKKKEETMYDVLQEYAIFLKRTENRQGLGKSYRDYDSEMID